MNYYQKGKPLPNFADYPKSPRQSNIPSYIKDAYGINIETKKPAKPEQTQPETNLNLYPIDEAFFRGNIFRGLYNPYKNYQPKMVVPTAEKDKLLFDVNKYFFGLHEIRLYLNAYPTDQDAINVFTEYQKEYIKAKNAYESKFGALDIEAPNLNTSPWNWTMGKWPWEGDK